MNVVGKVSSFLTQGMYSVATPFHPFGGAVDIIVVKQQDGTFRSTPWYVRFGKFQGVLKGAEKVVQIEVNGVEANFCMHLDNSGEAYFVREVDPDKDDNQGLSESNNLDGIHELKENEHGLDTKEIDNSEVAVRDERVTLGMDRLERVESRIYYEFQDEQPSLEGSIEFPEYGPGRHDNFDSVESALEPENSNSEVVLVSVDGHILTAPVLSSERDAEDVQLSTPRFHLGPGKGTEEFNIGEGSSSADYLVNLDAPACTVTNDDGVKANRGDGEHLHDEQQTDSATNNREICVDTGSDNTSCSIKKDGVFQSCQEFSELTPPSTHGDKENIASSVEVSEATEDPLKKTPPSFSTCDKTEEGNHEISSNEANYPHKEFNGSDAMPVQSVRNDQESQKQTEVDLAVKGMESSGEDLAPENECSKIQNVESQKEASKDDSEMTTTPTQGWRLWPIPFRSVKTLEHSGSNSSSEEVFVDSESVSQNEPLVTTPTAGVATDSPRKQVIRTIVPSSDQIAALNLKEGQNSVNFVFSTRVLGSQKVEAHIYLWMWNSRIVISDVDGTITKSDVLGQFMPLVGKDWTHSGIAGLFSAIKENGYQLLFLSARAIVQAYLTKSFLVNLKQDGKSLPSGPVVISPDGLFPSLYREVIRRAPHEFKIACLEDIKALFPQDYNPFYAGFGNRDTDELSYRKIGIPKGKIFIINPKGEVAINHRIDVKSYTSLHTLVHDMFPPTALVEQEDYNSWNYWKTPLPDIDVL